MNADTTNREDPHMNTEPTQPLTDAERAERANERADALDMAAIAWRYSDESVYMKPDVPGWLRRRAAALRSGTADEQQSEADRLRAENTAQAERIAKFLDPHKLVTRNVAWTDEGGVMHVSEHMVCDHCVPQFAHFHRREDIPEGPCEVRRALGVGDSSDPSALDQSGEGQANG